MTLEMFPLDQKTNDRLLMEESQRRQDLINQAVGAFAPHLASQDGVKVIHLYSNNASLRKAIREIAGGKTLVVEHCASTGRERKGVNEVQHEEPMLPLPDVADVVATKSGLSFKVELLAAQLRAQPVVLPEGSDWLRGVLDKHSAIVVVGGDQAK